ncbi:MAG: hypothetical protein ABFC90_09560 [Bacteroidales bacterium]|nr:hypothetical protein [Bacteroidales bacterium]
MKKTSLVVISIVFLFIACNSIKQKKEVLILEPQEERMISYINNNYYLIFNENEVKAKDALDQYDKSLKNIVDSCRLFHNWRGVISSIEIPVESPDGHILLKVNIELGLKGNCNISFNHEEDIYSKKEVDSSYIYNQLKQLEIGDTVYFDGFMLRDIKNNFIYNPDSFDVHPHNILNFQFYIVSLSKEKSIIDDFEKIKILESSCRNSYKYLRLKTNGVITNVQLNKYTEEIGSTYEALKPTLTKRDSLYSNRLFHYLFWEHTNRKYDVKY